MLLYGLPQSGEAFVGLGLRFGWRRGDVTIRCGTAQMTDALRGALDGFGHDLQATIAPVSRL